MSRLDPFDRLPEAPFEAASNRSFQAVLLAGVALLALAALVGRTPPTRAAVALYLCSLPVYVAVRMRTWQGDETDGSAADGPSDPDRDEEGGSDADDARTGDSPASTEPTDRGG